MTPFDDGTPGTSRARPLGPALGVLLLVVACSPGEPAATGEDGTDVTSQLSGEVMAMPAMAAGSGTAEAAGSVGPWTRPSASGVEVTLTAPQGPLRAGTTRFEIELGKAGPVLPVTVDLASPTMPMHGIVRFQAEHVEEQRYAVEAQIPMEGSWALYVNLDEGVDAAHFELEVMPAVTGDGQEHAGHSMEGH